jgi:nucleotide-binding universal stress UspA family protein
VCRGGVAFDGSPEARSALEFASSLAEAWGARITVLAVADYPHYGYASTFSVLAAEGIRDSDRERKAQLAEDACSRLPAWAGAEPRVLTGPAGDSLAEVSGDFDLIIAGSRGYGPIRRTLLGSTTRELISRSSSPVLVLPRGADASPVNLAGRPAAATAKIDESGAGASP